MGIEQPSLPLSVEGLQAHSSLLLTVVVVTLVAILVYRLCYAPYQVLKRYGMKGPTPLPLVGNYFTIVNKGFLDYFNDLYKKNYGPVCSFYMGRSPGVMAADPEIIKQITVKDFDAFTDRVNIPLIPDPYGPRGLLTATGDHWRDMRHSLTPAFSASKMKMMVPLVKRSTDTLVEKAGEAAESGKSVEIMRMYGAFTLESILAAAFGRVINLQRGEADEVTKAAKGVFDGGRNPFMLLVIFIMSTFPFLKPLLDYVMLNYTSTVEPWKVVHHTALKLIEARRNGTAKPAKYKDMLQLMIDASDDITARSEAAATSSECPVSQAKTSSRRKLTAKEIVDNSVTFLIAGYETTANTLSFATYLLATNPDIQEKLQREIDDYFDTKPDATLYEASQELTYLDNVIQETLRLYPPAPLTNRLCIKTVTLSDGVTIPQGSQVFVPFYALHHDPKYWEHPEEFNPDRFTAEERAKRPTTVHAPFGFGPRSCIGMRFALLETKIALMELLKRYTFVQAPDTEVPLQTMLGFTLTPKNNGIYVKVVARNN